MSSFSVIMLPIIRSRVGNQIQRRVGGLNTFSTLKGRQVDGYDREKPVQIWREQDSDDTKSILNANNDRIPPSRPLFVLPEHSKEHSKAMKARSESDHDIKPGRSEKEKSSFKRVLVDGQLKLLNFEFKSRFYDGSAVGNQTSLTITFPKYVCGITTSSPSETRSIPYIWLRDHCRCGECVNLETMQRKYDVFSAPPKIRPTQVEFHTEGLKIIWNDDHQSFYKWSWLCRHLKLKAMESKLADFYKRETFNSSIKHSPPSIDYEEVMSSDKGVAKWMRLIQKHGFSYVDNCPVSPEKTQELLERICFIRQTHYGGFYDFTSDLTMKDTAYTAEALDAHTDTTYFTDPIGYQMFHLLSHTNGTGGESLLVDGMHCASILAKEDPKAFDCLSKTYTHYHSSGNEGISLAPSRLQPVLSATTEVKPDGSEKLLEFQNVKWNRYDRATFRRSFKPAVGGHVVGRTGQSEAQVENWYIAARKWSEILKREENEYWEQLRPGRPLIFDNSRVLHGRSAFTGNRRICGGYLNKDDFNSRFLNLHLTREEVLEII